MGGLINLKVLHLDYNKLKVLETMPIMLKLETLTVSSNLITDTATAVKTIAMKCPWLIHLNLTNNPLDIDSKTEKYWKGVKKALGSLISLDGVPYEGHKAMETKTQVAPGPKSIKEEVKEAPKKEVKLKFEGLTPYKATYKGKAAWQEIESMRNQAPIEDSKDKKKDKSKGEPSKGS